MHNDNVKVNDKNMKHVLDVCEQGGHCMTCPPPMDIAWDVHTLKVINDNQE